jgi:hypothetical protein
VANLQIEDTAKDMKPGDLIKFTPYSEPWHIGDSAWKYGVLIDAEMADFSILYSGGIYNFSTEYWYIKKVQESSQERMG